MSQAKKKIAEKPEILRFYTSIMRGEDESASVSNRLSAADKLITQIDAESTVKSAEAKLDCILNEFRQAVRDGSIIAHDGEDNPADEETLYEIPVEEDEDEDQS